MVQVGLRVPTPLAVRKGLFSCEFLAQLQKLCLHSSQCLLSAQASWLCQVCITASCKRICICSVCVCVCVCVSECLHLHKCVCVCECMYILDCWMFSGPSYILFENRVKYSYKEGSPLWVQLVKYLTSAECFRM